MPGTYGQTELSNFTIPAGYTGYMKKYNVSMFDTNSNQAIMAIWRRPYQSAHRVIRPFVATTGSNIVREPYGGIKFEEKEDFLFRVISVVNTNADITVTWDMVLVPNS